MLPILQQLSDEWFLREPALFGLFCLQELREEVRMECAVRCGQGRLEYNPLILKQKNFREIEELMRIELIRLFLKHPYERRPEGCNNECMSAGSDITIADGYCTLHHEKLPLRTPDFYHLPLGQYYEWYAKELQTKHNDDTQDSNPNQPSQNPQGGDKSDNPSQNDSPQADSDKSQLWREDSLWRQRINELIDRTSDWGTLPAEVVEKIVASSKSHIDNRMVWQGFHSAILSSHRRPSRMRPNRRTGYLQMGSCRQFDTHLLVAIDTSGSISDEQLARFYGAINHMLRYGVTQIDACQFDAAMGPVTPLVKARREVQIKGRGGTSFQPVFDYMAHDRKYDGLIIFTDGEAPAPVADKHRLPPVLWVCANRMAYQTHQEWMRQTGRCCFL